MTRYPEPGNTKTRLIPALGAKGAAELQKQLTEKVVNTGVSLSHKLAVDLFIHYSGGSAQNMTDWLGPHRFRPQAAGNIGKRMQAAFTEAFAANYQFVVLIGSDIPGIDTNILCQAFATLQKGQAVLGPTRDGGYYLVGLDGENAPLLAPLLFSRMKWSTSEVFATSFIRLRNAGHEPLILPQLRDVDTAEDLRSVKSNGLL
jgi:rSAM/selenodomain-associated transferase 1